jgi:hypothetical protein
MSDEGRSPLMVAIVAEWIQLWQNTRKQVRLPSSRTTFTARLELPTKDGDHGTNSRRWKEASRTCIQLLKATFNICPNSWNSVISLTQILEAFIMVLDTRMSLRILKQHDENSDESRMKPTRVRMTHALVMNYGLYKKMEIYVRQETDASRSILTSQRSARKTSDEAWNDSIPLWRLYRIPEQGHP